MYIAQVTQHNQILRLNMYGFTCLAISFTIFFGAFNVTLAPKKSWAKNETGFIYFTNAVFVLFVLKRVWNMAFYWHFGLKKKERILKDSINVDENIRRNSLCGVALFSYSFALWMVWFFLSLLAWSSNICLTILIRRNLPTHTMCTLCIESDASTSRQIHADGVIFVAASRA